MCYVYFFNVSVWVPVRNLHNPRMLEQFHTHKFRPTVCVVGHPFFLPRWSHSANGSPGKRLYHTYYYTSSWAAGASGLLFLFSVLFDFRPPRRLAKVSSVDVGFYLSPESRADENGVLSHTADESSCERTDAKSFAKSFAMVLIQPQKTDFFSAIAFHGEVWDRLFFEWLSVTRLLKLFNLFIHDFILKIPDYLRWVRWCPFVFCLFSTVRWMGHQRRKLSRGYGSREGPSVFFRSL